MTSQPATGAAAGFALTVPASWFELDLRPATRDASAGDLVDQRLRDQPELADQRPAIVRLLRRQARQAADAGAVYAACMVEPTEDGPITAAVTVTLVDGPVDAQVHTRDDGRPVDRLTPLLERLHVKQPSGPDDTWTRVEVVEVEGAGECARTAGIEDVDLPDGAGWVRSVLMQTFVPVPGERTVLLLTCSSPVLPLSDVLLDLFDAVSGTLRIEPGRAAGAEAGTD